MLQKVAGLIVGDEDRGRQARTEYSRHGLVIVKKLRLQISALKKYTVPNSVFFSRFLALGQRNLCRSVPWPVFGAFDFPRSRTVHNILSRHILCFFG